jgi:hypothetical protein
MPTTGFDPTPDQTGAVGRTGASRADGVLVPLLWLAVLGYQAVVLMLKVVNRERPTAEG